MLRSSQKSRRDHEAVESQLLCYKPSSTASLAGSAEKRSLFSFGIHFRPWQGHTQLIFAHLKVHARESLQFNQDTATMTTQQGAISKRRKFVADGVFYAELNELFQRELAEEGYSGVEVRVTPTVTDISTETS